MAVDAPAVRRDLFDLISMFGPQNAGGPAQINTNPGTQPSPPSVLPEPPTSDPSAAIGGDPQATGSTAGSVPAAGKGPQPLGVRVLPQGADITPNGPAAAGAAAGQDFKNQTIEMLPGDADPNMLPPEIRDSWMFRYQQAQRAAQFKQAEQDARWANIVGGVGNIGQILSGRAPTYQQTAAHAKVPDATDVGTLYSWKKEYDAAVQAGEDRAKYADLVSRIKRDNPNATASDIDAIALDQKKLADYGFNRTDAKALADAAKARLDAVKTSQELAPAELTSPESLKAIGEHFHMSPDAIKNLPPQTLAKMVETVTAARATSEGGERVKLAGEDIKNAKSSNAALEQTLTRNFAARSAIESGAGITGGGFTETEFEAKAREIAGKLGWDRGAVDNDRVVMALMSKNAIDMSQDMKGSLSDKDIAMLNKAAAGDVNLSADEKSRIIALNDLQTRRKIDQNNAALTRAGERIGDDRSKEVSKPNPMTQAELREISPAIAREIIRNPEQGRKLAEFQYGKSVADELVNRAEEVITSRLHEQRPTDSKLKTQASQARTQLNTDLDSYLRTAPPDRLEANRDRVIQQLNAMDPAQNGAATYELILEAKRAGRYGAKP